MAPWTVLHVPSTGPLRPCCQAKGDFGRLDGNGIERLWNGPEMKAFRLGMLDDRKDDRCWKCYDMEAAGGVSLRNYYNGQFADLVDRVSATAPDGGVTVAPVSWDLRFSNLCNFRCRMCWHGSSSSWFEDGKAIGVTAGHTSLLRSVDDPRQFLDAIAETLDQLKWVYFAGGEPLLMEGHYLIVKALAERKLRHVVLSYNTNLSHLEYKTTSMLDLWREFDVVKLEVSIDGLAKRGELIRNGLVWDQLVSNLQDVRRQCPHVVLSVAIAVSVFNVLHLPELHRTLVEEHGIPLKMFWIHPIQEPSHYAVNHLPDVLKREALRRLDEHTAWCAAQAQDMGAMPAGLASVMNFLQKPGQPEALAEFHRITATLDARRDETTREVFPELAPLFDAP